MAERLQITAAQPDPAVLDLPWDVPLEQWPESVLAALPRGISRHIVRFVRLEGRIVAVKEIGETVALREYELLRSLHRIGTPSVVPLGVVTGRRDPQGEPLEAALITHHLQFSLPYRALFSRHLQPGTSARLVDALAVLLVRLHLIGFYWGDVSLSNTLFRRDAETFAAYLVDAETGELHDTLTVGQRNYDLEVARVNIIGELMDLEAGEMLETDVDPLAIGERLVTRYHELWDALTGEESFGAKDRWRVSARVERLNTLGFDVEELGIDSDGTSVSIQPKVVEAGHSERRLARLTGLQVHEHQARRLLNDLNEFKSARGRTDDLAARDWLAEVFTPAVEAVPVDLRGKLEPAQVYHEILDHRWFMSSEQQRDVPMSEATASYVDTVLRCRPDERAILGVDTSLIPRVDPACGKDDQAPEIPDCDDQPRILETS